MWGENSGDNTLNHTYEKLYLCMLQSNSAVTTYNCLGSTNGYSVFVCS